MSFYIRKAIKVGPFRFNLSKSGVGISAGVKGMRLGTGPRGNYVHMGRGGLYFRKSLNPGGSSPAQSPTTQPRSAQRNSDDTVEPMEQIESASVEAMADASSADLLKELNDKRKRLRFLPLAATICIAALVLMGILGVPFWALAILGMTSAGICWLVAVQDTVRKTTVILYDLEPEVEALYQELQEGFDRLRACVCAWHVESHGTVRDTKYHGGADAVVRRSRITLRNGTPPLVKTNVEIPLVPVGTQTLAFMPDRLLVFDRNGVGAVSYAALGMEVTQSAFIEGESVPRDTVVVDHTWRYVNKSGGPDKRFKDNRQIPICSYEHMHFWSSTGLNEVVQLSRPGAGEPFSVAIRKLGEFNAGQTEPTHA